MRKRDKTVWMIVLVGLLGLIVGFFLGEFFVYLSENIEFLSFMSFFGYSASLGPENISLNLIFARFSFGFTINMSIMGVVGMIVFLVIYFRRR